VPPGGSHRGRSLFTWWQAARGQIARWERASPDLLLQRSGGRIGLRAELPKEDFPEPLVVPQGLPSPSREGVKAHKPQVRPFVGRLLGHHPAQRFDAQPKLLTLLVECCKL
jgi:hypothetical protein